MNYFLIIKTCIALALSLVLVTPTVEAQNLENLGSNVNSTYDELAPLISPDGSRLYYSRIDHPNGKGSGDIWVSNHNENDTWMKAKPLSGQLNNSKWNSMLGVTADNSTVLLFGDYSEQGYKFSMSDKTASGWKKPYPVKFERKLYHKEGSYFAHLSADGQTMIVEIFGRDSYGSNDLYVSFRKENGSWTYPKNLGGTVNTRKKEITPFLAPDNKTLYYSTELPGGQGGWDIYMVKRLDDTWTKWSKPVNLGPTVNTPKWDAYYKIDSQGEYGYLVSEHQSYGKSDIQRIKLPKPVKPDPVLLLKGKALDVETGNTVSAKVVFKHLETGKVITRSTSSLNLEDYQVILPEKGEFAVYAEAKGYYALRDTLNLTELDKYGEIRKDVFLKAIEVDKPITLNNVFFVRSKAVLMPGSFDELNGLVKLLADNPHFKITVEGHTDNQGKPALNQKLSEDRAKKVRNYLIEKGIQKDRVSAKGYGQERPLNDNRTEGDRRANRRVEFRIL